MTSRGSTPAAPRREPEVAPARRAGAQARMELRLALRNGESLLVSFGIPLGLLVFFSLVPVLPRTGERAVDFLLPGVLALAVMSSAMVALGIATGFDREHLVLKRLGATPLRRGELVAAKVSATSAILVLQVIVLAVAGAVVGATPPAAVGWVIAPAGIVLGTSAFCGIGLTLAGRLPAMLNLAVVNALYLVLLVVSGIAFPLDVLPAAAAAVAGALPSTALAQVLRQGFGGGVAWGSLAVLAAWAVTAPLVAARTFRFE